MEWVGAAKESLIDDFILSEVFYGVADDVLEELSNELNLETREEVLNSIRSGDLYDRILDLGVKLDSLPEEEAFRDSIFGNEVDVSDALGVDYTLRGGKRLRPALTLLTDYALNDEVSYRSSMVGAAVEIVHASSLIHDDQMDEDVLRRAKLSSERVNRAFHGDKDWMHSVLDGNKVEAWANQALVSVTGPTASDEIEGIPNRASQKFFETEVELNDGQKMDLSMEDRTLRETDIEDYREMIEGKTGALYSAGVEIVLEDHISREEYTRQEEEKLRELFNEYVENFNLLFQAGDDAIEVFRPQNIGKSVTDIENRKSTYPALVTKEVLEEEDERYSELYLDVFDEEYDEVDESMREVAEEMDVPIPEETDDWENEWLTEVIREYGEEPSNVRAEEYLEDAREAIEELYDGGYINEASRDKYIDLAEFVWERDH